MLDPAARLFNFLMNFAVDAGDNHQFRPNTVSYLIKSYLGAVQSTRRIDNGRRRGKRDRENQMRDVDEK